MERKVLSGLFAAAALLSACNCTCGVKDSSVTPGSSADFEANVPNVVYFDFDKSKLSEAAKKRVEAQVAWLKTYSGTKATVEGYTDVRGTAEYNIALGQARANEVANSLKASGIESDRLTTVSYGKERLVDTGTTELAHAKNRRAVTVVG
ncbi:MAG: OmpA family protein [Holosporales bacterium]|jgi:peptidoglycan-associated lipoprotein|nr:OmpA family protein [Holosporales bacterium]